MSIFAIEGDTQEKILDVLPESYRLAIDVIAQLSANILLSGPTTDLEVFLTKVRNYHAAYIADET